MEIAFGLLAVIGIGILIALQFKRKAIEGISPAEYDRLKAELDRKIENITELTSELKKTQSEKDEMSGKNKTLFAELTNIKSDLKVLSQERDRLQGDLQEFKANERRREKEFNERLEKLNSSKEKLDEERERVTKEDEERRQQELEARDRLWADHENAVIAQLTDLCKEPAFSFTSYTNTSLPDGFDGSLKPDFMIDFLGQYVIFDAKVSKAKSLRTYIDDQVKKTVEKAKKDERIYKWIFLVVPASALNELTKHHYLIDGYQLFVVSPEAIPSILASFKRITMYEFAEQMDPQQRENIIQVIAELDFHINLRNAADIILSKMGTEILERTQKIDPSIAEEVALKKAPMNAKATSLATDIKKIVSKLTNQNIEIDKIVSPKISIRKKALEDAEGILNQTVL